MTSSAYAVATLNKDGKVKNSFKSLSATVGAELLEEARGLASLMMKGLRHRIL